MKEKKEAFARLLTIMDELREKCPWDKKQTLQSFVHLALKNFMNFQTLCFRKIRMKSKKNWATCSYTWCFTAKSQKKKTGSM
jgi:hypothetical protein